MTRESRKDDHLRLATSLAVDSNSGFDDIKLLHNPFPEIAYDDTNISTSIGPVPLQVPVLINAMTGGSRASYAINQSLAVVARETGMAMAVGSQRAALHDSSVRDTYTIVRATNPDGVIIANLGADATPKEAIEAVQMLDADLLQLHVNVPQELVMPEGDRNFSGMLRSIERIVQTSPVPVIVKEVGFGMSAETYRKLFDLGVKIVDVGGRGGTNFVAIENKRRQNIAMLDLTDWGQTTIVSLLEACDWYRRMDLIASGGIRNPLDVIKSLACGARAVGMAGWFLRTVQAVGIDGLLEQIQRWFMEIRTIMTMLGCKTIDELCQVPFIITGESAEWCQARGIDTSLYARRKRSPGND
jgi:isopentenyl-diphosphate Delta-isomerase